MKERAVSAIKLSGSPRPFRQISLLTKVWRQSLLDTSRWHEVSPVVEIDLSREEDAVTTLAVVESSDTSVTAFAGINSSTAEQDAGNNEHLRSFKIDYPPKKQAGEAEKPQRKDTYSEKTTPLARVSLFRPSSAKRKDTYQRVLRLSPAGAENTHRIGAVATGLAPEGEIVIFKAVPAPKKSDELGRIVLDKDEAADIAMTMLKDGDQDLLAYCTDTEVFRLKISLKGSNRPQEPEFVYGLPPPDAFATSPAKHKLRSLKFLDQHTLLLLQNRAGQSGVDLQILKLAEHSNLGIISLTKRLHKSMKAAVALDVCFLSALPSGEQQVIVAVAGSDNSIELLTLDYSKSKGYSTFRPYTILRDIHPGGITQIAFSNFTPPPSSPTEDRAEYVKLASVSFANTVVVHTLPLQSQSTDKSTVPRYVLAKSGGSEAIQTTFSVFMAILVVGIVAFFMQVFMEVRGGVPPLLGAVDWLSPQMRELIAKPYMLASPALQAPVLPTDIPRVEDVKQKLADLVSEQSTEEKPKAIIVRDAGGELSTEVHHDEEIVQREARRWEDLHEHERVSWRKKLTDAGHWTADNGETILKGVFFSELADMVGDIVRGA